MLYDGICRDVLSEKFHVRRPLFSTLISRDNMKHNGRYTLTWIIVNDKVHTYF
jgi:hypothetical protein